MFRHKPIATLEDLDRLRTYIHIHCSSSVSRRGNDAFVVPLGALRISKPRRVYPFINCPCDGYVFIQIQKRGYNFSLCKQEHFRHPSWCPVTHTFETSRCCQHESYFINSVTIFALKLNRVPPIGQGNTLPLRGISFDAPSTLPHIL